MTAKPGDPSLNPWLWPWHVKGFGRFGEEIEEIIAAPVPSLYFWLGAEAEKPYLLVGSIRVSENMTNQFRWGNIPLKWNATPTP